MALVATKGKPPSTSHDLRFSTASLAFSPSHKGSIDRGRYVSFSFMGALVAAMSFCRYSLTRPSRPHGAFRGCAPIISTVALSSAICPIEDSGGIRPALFVRWPKPFEWSRPSQQGVVLRCQGPRPQEDNLVHSGILAAQAPCNSNRATRGESTKKFFGYASVH